MGLRQNILNDRVSDLVLRGLIAVTPKTTVRDTVRQMRSNGLGCAIIVDEDGRPLGKFTERRLICLLAENPERLDDPIDQFLESTWASVNLTDPIAKVIERLQAGGERFVTVTDERGKAVGITGQKGVMEYIADHFPRQVKVQLMESKLYMDEREGA